MTAGSRTTITLPYWAALAFAARCSRRFADVYATDGAEPAAPRMAVQEAVRIAEACAARGGKPDEAYIELNGRHFDNYDIDALRGALGHYSDAAENTLADLQDCPVAGPEAWQILIAIDLARLVLYSAFPEDLGEALIPERVLEMVERGNEDFLTAAESDLELVLRLTKALGWKDEDGVPRDVFEPLNDAIGCDATLEDDLSSRRKFGHVMTPTENP